MLRPHLPNIFPILSGLLLYPQSPNFREGPRRQPVTASPAPRFSGSLTCGENNWQNGNSTWTATTKIIRMTIVPNPGGERGVKPGGVFPLSRFAYGFLLLSQKIRKKWGVDR
jgi:hypothetical protein